MASNQANRGRWHPNFLVPAACTVGMPILIGTMSGVILALQPISTPLAPVSATVDLGEDTYWLSVAGNSTQSPVTAEGVNPGDELFATGTYDAITNVTYNLTIDKTRGNIPFGNALTAVAPGATTLTNVLLKAGGSGAYAS